jgi:hypothetical protein
VLLPKDMWLLGVGIQEDVDKEGSDLAGHVCLGCLFQALVPLRTGKECDVRSCS